MDNKLRLMYALSIIVLSIGFAIAMFFSFGNVQLVIQMLSVVFYGCWTYMLRNTCKSEYWDSKKHGVRTAIIATVMRIFFPGMIVEILLLIVAGRLFYQMYKNK